MAIINQNIEGRQLSNNTTITPLSSAATYTGTWEQNNYPDVMVNCKTDNTGTLYFDFSTDGTNLDSTFPVNGFKLSSGINEFHIARKGSRYFRVRLVNDSGAQTYLRLYSYFGTFGQASAPINQTLSNDSDATIAHTIDHETDVMTGAYGTDRFSISKFGRNPDIDTGTVPEDIWASGGVYTGFPVSSSETVEVFSSSTSDTSAGVGARTIRIIGLDANYLIQQEDLTLNGTTAVTSVGTYRRLNRAYMLTAGTSVTNVGTITIRHTTTTANVFAGIAIGFGQTEIAGYTIPAGYVGYLKSYRASMLDSGSNKGIVGFWTREFGGAVRIQRTFAVATDTNTDISLYSGVMYPEKTDIMLRCLSVLNSNAVINGSFGILLIKNQ